MLDKLLDGLGRVWNKLPKSTPALTLQKGSGSHRLITITSKAIVFHSLAYYPDMPLKQEILLDDYTIFELVDIMQGMGYVVSVAPEAVSASLTSRKSVVLLHAENQSIDTSPYVLAAFTSSLWQVLYPIARVLEDLDRDTDDAIKQMYATTTSGKWLDYWATFFKLKRLTGESDFSLQKRMFVAIMNMRTNNIALRELVQYAVGGNVLIEDVAPAQFRISIDPVLMNTAGNVHQVIKSNKAAGVDYILNYLGVYFEGYKKYFIDKNNMKFQDSDTQKSSSSISSSEVNFRLDPTLTKVFRIGSTPIRTGYSILQKKVMDGTYYGSWERWLTETKYTKPIDMLQNGQFVRISEPATTKPKDMYSEISTPLTEGGYLDRASLDPITFRIGSSKLRDEHSRLSRQDIPMLESIAMSLILANYPYTLVRGEELQF